MQVHWKAPQSQTIDNRDNSWQILMLFNFSDVSVFFCITSYILFLAIIRLTSSLIYHIHKQAYYGFIDVSLAVFPEPNI